MTKLNKAYIFLYRWFKPSLLSLQSIIGILQLLDALGNIRYFVDYRSIKPTIFKLGFELYRPLLVLFLLYIICIIKERKYSSLILPIFSLALYFKGLKIALPMGSFLVTVNYLLITSNYYEFVSSLLIILGGFEILTLVHWLFFIPLGITSPFTMITDVETSINKIIANASIIFVLGLILSWIPKSITFLKEKWRYYPAVMPRSIGRKNTWAVVLLLFSILLGVIAAVYPYNPILNPQGFGVDVRDYIKGAAKVDADLSQAFVVLGGTRPLIFMLIWAYQRLLGINVVNAIHFLPVLLNPLMVLGAFFIGKEASDDWWIGSWAAFFTACSYHVTVGMFSYFLTNMLALSIVFTSLGLLFRALRLKSKRTLGYACLIGSLLAFTHPWTYTQYFVATVATTVVVGCLAYINRSSYEETHILSMYSVALGLSNIIKELLLGGYGGVAASSGVIRSIYGLGEFFSRYKFGVMLRHGGNLINVVLFFFAFIGILSRKQKQTPDIYFIILLLVTSPLFFIGKFSTLGRLLYNLPIGLFASYGFISILRSQIVREVKFSLKFFTCLYLTVYLIRSIAFLV
jgi:hypothetical protein